MAKGANSYIKVNNRKTIIASSDYCFYCEEFLTIKHIDHIIPPKNGGNSKINNLILSCNKCNSTKSDLELGKFYKNIAEKRDSNYKKLYKILRYLRRHKNNSITYNEYCIEFRKFYPISKRYNKILSNIYKLMKIYG